MYCMAQKLMIQLTSIRFHLGSVPTTRAYCRPAGQTSAKLPATRHKPAKVDCCRSAPSKASAPRPGTATTAPYGQVVFPVKASKIPIKPATGARLGTGSNRAASTPKKPNSSPSKDSPTKDSINGIDTSKGPSPSCTRTSKKRVD